MIKGCHGYLVYHVKCDVSKILQPCRTNFSSFERMIDFIRVILNCVLTKLYSHVKHYKVVLILKLVKTKLGFQCKLFKTITVNLI